MLPENPHDMLARCFVDCIEEAKEKAVQLQAKVGIMLQGGLTGLVLRARSVKVT